MTGKWTSCIVEEDEEIRYEDDEWEVVEGEQGPW